MERGFLTRIENGALPGQGDEEGIVVRVVGAADAEPERAMPPGVADSQRHGGRFAVDGVDGGRDGVKLQPGRADFDLGTHGLERSVLATAPKQQCAVVMTETTAAIEPTACPPPALAADQNGSRLKVIPQAHDAVM